MRYTLQFKPQAVKDLKKLNPGMRRRIIAGIELLKDNLQGDVKRLTNFSPEYRLRIGDYRILFEIEGSTIIIYRVIHRREAYR